MAIMAELRKQLGQQVKDGAGAGLPRPADPRAERGRRIQAHGRGPRRAGAGQSSSDQTDAWSQNLQKAAQSGRRLHAVPLDLRRNSTWTSTAPRSPRWASRWTTSTRRLEVYLGSLYVNNFNAFGRDWQVNVQAEGDFRNRVDDINLLKVRNNQGQMVPLGALGNVREIGGPIFVNRYNLYTAAADHRQPTARASAPAKSSTPVDEAGRQDAAPLDEPRSGPN